MEHGGGGSTGRAMIQIESFIYVAIFMVLATIILSITTVEHRMSLLFLRMVGHTDRMVGNVLHYTLQHNETKIYTAFDTVLFEK